MAKTSQFEEFEERHKSCAVCEAMLPDAVDGTLSDAEQVAFDKHVANCAECARELADARRGAAWLGMLKSKAPEPPAGLLARILSETTGAVAPARSVIAPTAILIPSVPVPSALPSSTIAAPVIARPAWETAPHLTAATPRNGFSRQWRTFRNQLSGVFSIENARTTFQPRLAMTAAMAFFSLALTLNLTGVRLRDLRASNFTPSALMRTMADAEASATRLFQNNRAVYQVESRLSELRSDDAPDNTSPDGHR